MLINGHQNQRGSELIGQAFKSGIESIGKGSDKSGNHKGINRCRLGNATANNIRIYLVVISSFCISTSNGLTEKIHAKANRY